MKRIGPGFVEIPLNYLGQALNEYELMGAMRRCNPDIHFDVGANLDIWHPYQSGKQGVWHAGRHLAPMDRGIIPMVPIWSTKREGVRVEASDLSHAELTDPMTLAEVAYGLDGSQNYTGWHFLQRDVRDRLLWVGWHHTLRRVCHKGVPGLTTARMTEELGITLDWDVELDELEVAENRTHLFDGQGRSVSVG